jgi:hypothetical protein
VDILYFYYHANQTRDIVKRERASAPLFLSKKSKSIEILLGRECATKIFVRLLGFDADGGKGSERNMDGGGSVLVKTTFMASVA